MFRFLTRSVEPDPNCVAATIPLDIFVDNISPYLQVEDILALRRVNKHYFHLTHEPLIWKRFLQELKIPLPPIRPTFNYSVQSSDYEFEQLVSRAISVEDNWRKKNPAVASTMSFDACLEVLDMKLLPGGKYLIASIRDDYRFFIALYHLDHPTGPHILARCQIPTKAYQLQAKYMAYKHKPVIMIAFICREFYQDGPTNIDPAKFANNATIDPPAPIAHLVNCIHVDLSTVDLLAGAHRDPAGSETTKHKLWSSYNEFQPFTQTVRMPLKKPTAQLSLYSRAGVAHASFIQPGPPNGQDYLVIVNIEYQTTNILVFEPFHHQPDPYLPVTPLPNMEQCVKAVCHCPEQNQVLIWRTIRTGQQWHTDHPEGYRMIENHAHAIEIVDMPDDTREEKVMYATPQAGYIVLPQGTVQTVHMVDDIWPYDGQSDFPLQSILQPPPPISIFAEMTRPQGILHWHIWPEYGFTQESPPYVYDPHPISITKQTMHNAEPHIGHVLPGVFRSLIYTTEKTDRTATPSLTSLRRYISPEFQADMYSLSRVQRHSDVERNDYQDMPRYVYTKIDLGPDATARYREFGLGAIAWDHAIGRLCMTTGGGSVIEVIDFSRAAPPDARFLDWKMAAPGGFEDMDAEGENEFVVARNARRDRRPYFERRIVSTDDWNGNKVGGVQNRDVEMDSEYGSNDSFYDP